jgi:hypothetical protein
MSQQKNWRHSNMVSWLIVFVNIVAVPCGLYVHGSYWTASINLVTAAFGAFVALTEPNEVL